MTQKQLKHCFRKRHQPYQKSQQSREIAIAQSATISQGFQGVAQPTSLCQGQDLVDQPCVIFAMFRPHTSLWSVEGEGKAGMRDNAIENLPTLAQNQLVRDPQSQGEFWLNQT
uniref:Uncharacterized protein n=1 Tax=Eutreptiella gymnastica TaxID=73025 RepID=A0A7S1I578_9EUGL|mmetsp:Transcript_131128/g.226992  ORF Transcript_131128/g.226992 Transcript_131128/m.226992 type:complete len:113 (+) Transcript_131128:814-1152(+)